jgi:hypothetical protein
MKDVPKWVWRIIEAEPLACSKCEIPLESKDLISIGIMKSSISHGVYKLSIGLKCSKCQDVTIYELKEMSLIEFAFELLEGKAEEASDESQDLSDVDFEDDFLEEDNDSLEELSSQISAEDQKPFHRITPKKKNKKTKITQKEMNEAVRFLNKSRYFEDILIAMGASPEDFINKKNTGDTENKGNKNE